MKNTLKHHTGLHPGATATELGKRLGGLTADDVRELVDTTDIPHSTVKGELRFDPVEISMWLDENTVKATRPAPTPADLAAGREAD